MEVSQVCAYGVQCQDLTEVCDRPSIADIGSPHATSADCEYEGYKIPAGTIVTTNHWLISNNPNEYDQPARFMPERFLNENLDKRLHGHQGFGAGESTQISQ